MGLQLNNITGYHHLMTLNEQLVKHQLRAKFMLEALSILQKVVKDKGQAGGSQLKQKALIKSALLVIESLIKQCPTMCHIAADNYVNSLRVCFMRDASHKDLNLPSGFLKLVDELLSDIIDVSAPQNADIVAKCVSILRIVAEFINTEKKREEKKHSPKKSPARDSQRVDDREERKEPIAIINELRSEEDEEPREMQVAEPVFAEQEPAEDDEDEIMADDDHMIVQDPVDEEDDGDDLDALDDEAQDMLDEEDMDEYGEDDDGSMLDEPNAIVVGRRGGAAPQMDIINFQNAQQRIDPNHPVMGWRLAERRQNQAN